MLWVIITGVFSLALCWWDSRFGTLGLLATVFMFVDQLIKIPWGITLLVGVFALVIFITAVLPRPTKQLMGVFLPSYGMAMLALVAGIAMTPMTVSPAMIAIPTKDGSAQVALVGSVSMSQTQQVDAATECPSGARYYAYEAEAGTNNMGPAIQLDSVEAGAYRFNLKKECDPLWLATTVHAFKYGKNLDQTQVQAEAQSYLDDPTLWTAAMQFVDEQVAEFLLVNAGSVPYDSLGMIPGSDPGVMPTLTKFSQQPALGQALLAKLQDGSFRYFRVECDMQFSVPTEFSKVTPPATPEKPPTTPPSTFTTPPSTTTTPSTSTTTTVTTTTPSTKTTTTTPETSTTTTTPETSTTTTTKTTTTTTGTTTSTTTTPPTTTTTSTKGDGPAPSGMPTDTVHGDPEDTAPVESDPADPATTEGQADPGEEAPGATQETSQEPVPTVEPTGGADPTTPHEGDVDPDGNGGAALLLIPALLGGTLLRRKLGSRETADE